MKAKISFRQVRYQIQNCGTATGHVKAGGPIGHTRWCNGGVYYSGFTTAITLTAILALPPVLCAPADLPRTSAGMFTISYTTAIIVPTVSGALWDWSGKPWMAFVPLCLCAVTLTVLGAITARIRPTTES